jgi:hypothetical protein
VAGVPPDERTLSGYPLELYEALRREHLQAPAGHDVRLRYSVEGQDDAADTGEPPWIMVHCEHDRAPALWFSASEGGETGVGFRARGWPWAACGHLLGPFDAQEHHDPVGECCAVLRDWLRGDLVLVGYLRGERLLRLVVSRRGQIMRRTATPFAWLRMPTSIAIWTPRFCTAAAGRAELAADADGDAPDRMGGGRTPGRATGVRKAFAKYAVSDSVLTEWMSRMADAGVELDGFEKASTLPGPAPDDYPLCLVARRGNTGVSITFGPYRRPCGPTAAMMVELPAHNGAFAIEVEAALLASGASPLGPTLRSQLESAKRQ